MPTVSNRSPEVADEFSPIIEKINKFSLNDFTTG